MLSQKLKSKEESAHKESKPTIGESSSLEEIRHGCSLYDTGEGKKENEWLKLKTKLALKKVGKKRGNFKEAEVQRVIIPERGDYDASE